MCLPESREIKIRVCFSSDMDKKPRSRGQSADGKRGEITSRVKQRRKRAGTAGESIGEIQIGTWKLFPRVLSKMRAGVIRRERKRPRERRQERGGQPGNVEVGRGQRKGFLPLVLKRRRV